MCLCSTWCVDYLFSQCQWFFGSWDEDVAVPLAASADAELAPVTGVNNEMLLKAELMGLSYIHFSNLCILLGRLEFRI